MIHYLKKIQTSYRIEVSVEEALKLFYLEPVSLEASLKKIKGISQVEYDGHFGPYVYLTLDEENDTPKTHALICKLIERPLKKVIRKRHV